MSITESKEFENIVSIYEQNKLSFKERKKSIETKDFSNINWSSSYLGLTPFGYIFNQLKNPKIYKEEKTPSIKNYFTQERLIYSVNVENETWGSAFIDYNEDSHIWFLFVKNYDDEMVLRQIRLIHTAGGKIHKELFYLFNQNTNEETFMIDLYEYNEDNTFKLVTREGFYQNKSSILPTREFIFNYNDKKMQIISKMEGLDKQIIEGKIYDGKIIK